MPKPREPLNVARRTCFSSVLSDEFSTIGDSPASLRPAAEEPASAWSGRQTRAPANPARHLHHISFISTWSRLMKKSLAALVAAIALTAGVAHAVPTSFVAPNGSTSPFEDWTLWRQLRSTPNGKSSPTPYGTPGNLPDVAGSYPAAGSPSGRSGGRHRQYAEPPSSRAAATFIRLPRRRASRSPCRITASAWLEQPLRRSDSEPRQSA